MTDKRFLDGVYDLGDSDETRRYYDRWSDSYDAEVADAGYATPARCAAALKASGLDSDAAILDFGCGTGLSGAALADAGFTTIDGTDLSAEMLAKAEARGVYRKLWQADAHAPLVVDPGTYAAVAAVGVIGPGAAPPEALDPLVAALETGGLLAMSYNDHALAETAYTDRLAHFLDSRTLTARFEAHGPHLPALNLGSIVYILEKA